jgi:CheY-like chemotaxis protein
MAQNPTLLLIEDNEDDIFLMQRALKKAQIDLPLQIVMDGQEAFDYLKAEGRFSDRSQFPRPALIFLDLKLPYFHGFEILEFIQQNESLRNVPVVILTSSPEDRDRRRARELGAKGYYVKPPAMEALIDAMKLLKNEPVPASA